MSTPRRDSSGSPLRLGGPERRPRQPRQHPVGRQAARAFEHVLPAEFSATPPSEGDDYGWDHIVMTERDGYFEYHFFSQVKGSDRPTYLADGQHLSHDFEVWSMLWLLDQPIPTMLAVCDTGKSEEPVYWIWLADAVAMAEAARGDGWRHQATVALHIPLANRLARDQRDRIADDVARAIQALGTAAVPTAPAPVPAAARRRPRPRDYVAWTRFWGPLGIEPQLDDAYLLDPLRYAPFANKDGQTLEQLAARPCLVLLGPMGMGKSTAIDEDLARVTAAGGRTLAFDLLEFETAEALAGAWFGSPGWREFLDGSEPLTVYLDSVDEMATPLPSLLRHLRERLHGVDLSRLRLRVVCRSGAWPPAFGEALTELYGDQVEVRTLWPLRRADVLAAAVYHLGPDRSDTFLRAIRDRDAQALAARPTTLRFLLEAAQATTALPSAPSDLYREGCLRLCADDQVRARAGHLDPGRLTARERLAVAQAMATMSLLTGRRVLLRQDPPLPIDGCLSPRDLVGVRAEADGKVVVLDDRSYQEVLTTGLLTAAGGDRVRWAHASYADFLGALFLRQRSPGDLRRLVVTRDDAGEFIAPQLRELAVWLAELRPELLATLLPLDPLLAVQGAARAPDPVKATIVERWLDGVRAGSVQIPVAIFSQYSKLRHPGLAAQLAPRIGDRARPPHERRVASDIAEACDLVELQALWVRLAVDTTEDHDVRVAAADAVVRLGDTGAKAALEPLARGAAGPDPDDDLRGLGLMAVYPQRWDLKTLLPYLSVPQREDYLGYYEYFLSDVLPSRLAVDDLPTVLGMAPAWFRRRVGFRELIAKATAAAWAHLARHDIAQALAHLLVARIRTDEGPFDDD